MIQARLGAGGFGAVYRAWDERLDRPVAVKVVERAAASGRGSREAQAAARLTHRGIATLYELAESGDHTFLVCELVEGRTLAALAASGELSDRAVASIGAEASAALAHAHRHHVVHRDIKPQNLMVPEGSAGAKVVDFGVARICDRPTLTRTGAVVGTIAYMAPEQAEGQRAGPAADVFSLALTLYECLAAHHPHLRDGPAATARAIGEPVDPLSELRPDLPVELCDAIDAALERDPELRPLASELESALRQAQGQLADDALPPLLVAQLSEPLEAQAAPIPPAAVPAALALAGTALIWTAAAGPTIWLAAAPLAALASVRRVGAAVWLLGAGLAVALAGQAGAGAAATALLGTAVLAAAAARAGRAALLAPLAIPLAAVSAGVAFPAAAAAAGSWRGRAAVGAAGAILAVLAASAGAELAVPAPEPGAAWGGDAAAAIEAALEAVVAPGALLMIVTWAAAAAVLPALVRGRLALLDAVGVLVWAATVVSLTRIATESAAASGAAPALIAVLGAFSYAVAVNPALRPRPSRGPVIDPRERSPMGLSA